MKGRLPNNNRDADGDDDHAQDAWVFQPADEEHFDAGSDNHGDANRQGNGHRQGEKMQEGDGQHSAQHHELTLRKVNDAGSVVDDVETYGNDGIYAAIGNACHQVLEE